MFGLSLSEKPCMLSNKARLALFDIRENGKLACEFVAGLTYEEFERDRRTLYAVTRALEIISEAARRLPPELQARHPSLPWRAIMGVGNIYRHNYDNVAEQQVWRTVRESVPSLLAAVAEEIEALKNE
jgi:uncharacterized protein with HEPN domain